MGSTRLLSWCDLFVDRFDRLHILSETLLQCRVGLADPLELVDTALHIT